MRGGEKVLESLCRIFPRADIFTLFYAPERVSETIRSHRVQASFLNPLRMFHGELLPLMPMALESFDLSGYDLIFSSESGPAKGVITHSNSRHICYCHTPMRYLWDLYPAYRNRWTRSRLKRAAMIPLTSYLRLWDFAAAARVDEFVANSRNVQRRIAHVWGRESRVIYPPVDVAGFYSESAEDYFLIVSELVPYKQLDYAIRVFSTSGRRLRVVGKGPEYSRLRKMAAPSVEFCGRVSDSELRKLYARCRALIVPGEEDFGIVTVEALASGKPVIALARGGSVEIVPPRTAAGVLYEDATEACLEEALVRFSSVEQRVNPLELKNYAAGFSEAAFQSAIESLVEERPAGRVRTTMPDSCNPCSRGSFEPGRTAPRSDRTATRR
jgi:glycosyltransferase involved in cell wall biosynthesis